MIGRSGTILCHLSSSCLREPTGAEVFICFSHSQSLPAHPCQPVGGWYGYTRRLSSPTTTCLYPFPPPPPPPPPRLLCPCTDRTFFFFHNVTFRRQRVVDKSFSSKGMYKFLPRSQVAIEMIRIKYSGLGRKRIHCARRIARILVLVVDVTIKLFVNCEE